MLAYPQWRRSQRKTADTTIRNEMSTINACMAYLYDVEKMGSFRQFYLPKYTKARVDVSRVKRETFEADEYMAFVRAMREYVREDVDPDELSCQAAGASLLSGGSQQRHAVRGTGTAQLGQCEPARD